MTINGEKVFSKSFKLWELDLRGRFDELIMDIGKDLEILLVLTESDIKRHLEQGVPIENMIKIYYKDKLGEVLVSYWGQIIKENISFKLRMDNKSLIREFEFAFEDECISKHIEFEEEVVDFLNMEILTA